MSNINSHFAPADETLGTCLSQIKTLEYSEDTDYLSVQDNLFRSCKNATISNPSNLIPIILGCIEKFESLELSKSNMKNNKSYWAGISFSMELIGPGFDLSEGRFRDANSNERFYWVNISVSLFNYVMELNGVIDAINIINANDRVKSFITKHYLESQKSNRFYSCEPYIVLEEELEKNKTWSVDEFKAFSTLLYPNIGRLSPEEIFLKYYADISEDSLRLLMLKLDLIVLLDDNIGSMKLLNDLTVNIFNKIMGSISFFPLGGNDALFYSLRKLIWLDEPQIKAKINFFINNLAQQELVAEKIQSMLPSKDFVILLDMVPSLKILAIQNERVFNRLLRGLLNDHLFDNIIIIIREVTEKNYLSEAKILSTLQRMLLLKKGVDPVSLEQIQFLKNIANMFTDITERQKLLKRLQSLEKKISIST